MLLASNSNTRFSALALWHWELDKALLGQSAYWLQGSLWPLPRKLLWYLKCLEVSGASCSRGDIHPGHLFSSTVVHNHLGRLKKYTCATQHYKLDFKVPPVWAAACAPGLKLTGECNRVGNTKKAATLASLWARWCCCPRGQARVAGRSLRPLKLPVF